MSPNRPKKNPNSWQVKKSYTNHIDVRSAIEHGNQPIHFEPDEIGPGWQRSAWTNTCDECGETYKGYLVLIQDHFSDIVNYVDNEDLSLCKPCRFEHTDYGAYGTQTEYDAIEAFEAIGSGSSRSKRETVVEIAKSESPIKPWALLDKIAEQGIDKSEARNILRDLKIEHKIVPAGGFAGKIRFAE